jgi:LCP family protein required for cell wall assembly
MLIMGIDSTEDDIKSATSFNGDSLILVTFNPKTLNATMLSIPRDTFVPIMCFSGHKKNKITHAAWYGESCMIDTIENFTGINIDYYAKINFKGVVKLVDALGGVQVDVPYSFCEQNSNREWGKNTVYVQKGLQTLTGEQALAFSRNRHTNPSMCSKKWTNYYSDDFVRGQNQQTVIRSIIDKLKTVRDVNKLYEVLDLIEKSMDTNLSTNQILSFYNIGKSILAHSKTDGELLNFQKLYLSTYGAMIYDEEMRMNLSDQIYYEDSLKEVVDAMQVNLGLKEPTIIKTFSFSVNKTYEEKVIGKGVYSESSVPLVPTFTSGKYTKATATSWGSKNGVSITFKTVDSSESKYIEGQIIAQSVPSSSLVSIAKTKGITLTIVHKTTSSTGTPSSSTPSGTSSRIDCTDADNKGNSVCDVPNFVGKDLSAVTAWQAKITSGSIIVVKSSETTSDKDKDNEVFEQEGPAVGSSLYNSSSHTLTIKYYRYEAPTLPDTDPAVDNSGATQQ